MTRYIGVRDEYAPKFGRQRLTLWSGGFSSDFEGFADELPGHNGYMLRLDYVPGHPKIRVECPSPRTDANFMQVDAAIRAAFETAVREATKMTMSKDQALRRVRELASTLPDDTTKELIEVLVVALDDLYDSYRPDAAYALYLAHDLTDLAKALTAIGGKMQELADAEA